VILLHYICILLVLAGTVIMAVAIRNGLHVNTSVPGEFHRRWSVITMLMVSFLAGYCGFVVMQVFELTSFLELITSLLFFGGALFVLLIINLSRMTIFQLVRNRDQADAANSDLRKKTIELENEIANQARTEKELREAKATLENIFNSSIPICITSTDHEIIDANDAYYRLFDAPRNELDKIMCYDSRPGSTCNTDGCPVKRINQGEKEVVAECTKMDEQGKLYYFIVTARPFRNSSGELVGIVESFQDITLRKSAENLLAMEKERLAITLQSIGDGVITTDLKGNILMLNRVAESLCGWTIEEAMGRPLADIYHLVDFTTRRQIDNPVTRVIKTGKAVSITPGAVLVALDGWERFIADSAAPILDHKGNMFGVVLVFRDISEKRKMESEISKLEKLKAVGLLAGGIAHDFNNLLTAILGNISMAKIAAGTDETVTERLQKAENAIIKAKGLTHQLLTFSRGGEPQKKVLSLDKLLRETVELVLRGSNTFYEFAIREDLRSVEADIDQMVQAINNLAINASQSMPEGGQLSIRAENFQHTDQEQLPMIPGEYVKVSFTDHGDGIPDDHLPFIFDPYFTTKKSGSGLGLSTVYSVVNRHGGYIDVVSTPGEGSTFTFYLPASDKKPSEPAAPPKQVPTGAGRVLVMDDDAAILDVAGVMLTELGYEPSFAHNGQEALALYGTAMEEGRPFNGVILDLTIPGGMGGRQTLSKLRDLDPEVKAIVSSGYSNDQVIANFKDYGFKASVNKPYSISELAFVLRRVLSGVHT